jgi:hypothetical protein
MTKSRSKKKIKPSSKKDGVRIEYENGEEVVLLQDEVNDSLNAKILRIVCKIIGKAVPRANSDASIISYLIISLFLLYVRYEFSSHSLSVNNDILLSGVFSLSQFANVLPTVLSRSMKLQSELLKCISKKSVYRYFSSFSGKVPEEFDMTSEIKYLVEEQIKFTEEELGKLKNMIPKDIDDYMKKINDNFETIKKKIFNKIENTGSLILYDENIRGEQLKKKYKNLSETCPNFINPLNEIISQELSASIDNIKTRIKNEITTHQHITKNKINEMSYNTTIVLTVIILCIILFSNTFVIAKIFNCLKKPKTIYRKPLKSKIIPSSQRLRSRSKTPSSPRRRSRSKTPSSPRRRSRSKTPSSPRRLRSRRRSRSKTPSPRRLRSRTTIKSKSKSPRRLH